MKQSKVIFAVLLVFVIVLGGAYALYGRLGQKVEAEQLSVNDEAAAQPTASDAPAAEQEAEENAENDAVPAPDFTVYDENGAAVQLSDYAGKPIVLNFWASWCGPCQMEMPDFYEKYLEREGDVHFVMVNMTDGSRETVDTASAFLQENGYTFDRLFDSQQNAAMTYGAYSLPTTFFIDAEGNAIAQATGAIDGETLQRGIDMICG